jgi:hypothetical protein
MSHIEAANCLISVKKTGGHSCDTTRKLYVAITRTFKKMMEFSNAEKEGAIEEKILDCSHQGLANQRVRILFGHAR